MEVNETNLGLASVNLSFNEPRTYTHPPLTLSNGSLSDLSSSR